MSKKPTSRTKSGTRRRSRRSAGPQTNWLLVGGIIVAGVIVIALMAAYSLRQPESSTVAEYCRANPSACVAFGDENAPITLIEVFDYGCGHCRDFHVQSARQLKAEYVDTGDVQLIYLPYSLGDATRPAAQSGLCAAEQGRYEAYSDALFSLFDQPGYLSLQSLDSAATMAGLDMAAFDECLDSGRYSDEISANIRAAANVGINSTPSFLVNDVLVSGNRPSVLVQEFNRILGS